MRTGEIEARATGYIVHAIAKAHCQEIIQAKKEDTIMSNMAQAIPEPQRSTFFEIIREMLERIDPKDAAIEVAWGNQQ